MEKRMWIRRILGILLIVGGFLFGASRGPAGVCPGDRIFSALGLPVWSQGTTGTHYPGLAGLAAAMAGIAVVWIWSGRPWDRGQGAALACDLWRTGSMAGFRDGKSSLGAAGRRAEDKGRSAPWIAAM